MELKNKKGFLFTLSAIVLLSLFLSAIMIKDYSSKKESIKDRVETMNSLMKSTEKDLQRQVYISGFRIILIAEKSIIESGNYISNVTEIAQELFVNGELYGNPEEIMDGATFQDISESLIDKAKKSNANATFIYESLTLSQDDPWRVKISLKADLYLKDNNNLVSWNKTKIIESYVPLESFSDPIHVIETRGKIIKKIKRTPFEILVFDNDVTNLTIHYQEGYYKNNSDAPSYLKRLEGSFNPDENGIESLTNLQELSQQGIEIEDKSVIDYIYFSNQNPSSFKISGMPQWFKIDSDHLELYQVSNISY
jgi:hypothetical protein